MKKTDAKLLLQGLCPSPKGWITAVTTDSRRVEPGCVFVCFPGERVDGHDFAAQAVADGAAYVVANRPIHGVPGEKLILCENSYQAMLQIGANYRTQFSPLMVGVTGSVGKTTTKEFCYSVLSAFGTTLKTEGNQNNELGLPNTLLRLADTDAYAVVEMGMSHLGEISRLTRTARPTLGIITGIGVSHLENLGSRENILKAKLELCEGLPNQAVLVLKADDDLLPGAVLPEHVRPCWFGIDSPKAQVRAEQIEQLPNGQRFLIVDAELGEFAAFIPALGRHNVYDALAAFAAATRLGLDPERAAKALANYQTTGLRQHVVQKRGVTVVEDCYNASPDSMKASLEMFAALPAKHKVALLGDMLELGAISAQAHQQVGEWAAQSGISLLVAYGPESAAMARAAQAAGLAVCHCTQPEQAAQLLAEHLAPGDALLAKASRGMRLEAILQKFYGEDEGE